MTALKAFWASEDAMPVDPYTLILLAQQEFSCGRTEQATELVEQAFSDFDRTSAMPDQASNE